MVRFMFDCLGMLAMALIVVSLVFGIGSLAHGNDYDLLGAVRYDVAASHDVHDVVGTSIRAEATVQIPQLTAEEIANRWQPAPLTDHQMVALKSGTAMGATNVITRSRTVTRSTAAASAGSGYVGAAAIQPVRRVFRIFGRARGCASGACSY